MGMKKREDSNFDIPFGGLALGAHQFDVKINDSFFKSIEYSEIKQGNITAEVKLIKESTMLLFNFYLRGYVELVCDRCLENYNQELEGTFKLIVKFAEEEEEISDEIITISHDKTNINLTHYLYEYIILLLPLKHVHPDDENGEHTCNVEMLQQLEKHVGTKTDPRWAALKNIKLD